jgi:hypothetical protein
MSVAEIKKYFTKNSQCNFLNDFTLQDVEDAKKNIYMKHYKKESKLFSHNTYVRILFIWFPHLFPNIYIMSYIDSLHRYK